jgi:hypothetical protein
MVVTRVRRTGLSTAKIGVGVAIDIAVVVIAIAASDGPLLDGQSSEADVVRSML